jgi:hypothetical protein
MTDKIPFALIHNYGRPRAFTCDEYRQAESIARLCRCGECDCCAVVVYVKSQSKEGAR